MVTHWPDCCEKGRKLEEVLLQPNLEKGTDVGVSLCLPKITTAFVRFCVDNMKMVGKKEPVRPM